MRLLPSDIVLRPAIEADLPFLLDLRQQTMTAHLLASGLASDDDEHLRRIKAHFPHARIVERGGVAIGLLKLVPDGDDWVLQQIQLCPSAQGRGLGASLVALAINEARSGGATQLWLSVLRANPARRLYERLGFVLEGEDAHAFEMRHALR